MTLIVIAITVVVIGAFLVIRNREVIDVTKVDIYGEDYYRNNEANRQNSTNDGIETDLYGSKYYEENK